MGGLWSSGRHPCSSCHPVLSKRRRKARNYQPCLRRVCRSTGESSSSSQFAAKKRGIRESDASLASLPLTVSSLRALPFRYKGAGSDSLPVMLVLIFARLPP
jgi:hypothetical protein